MDRTDGVVSVVHGPIANETYAAQRGGDATLNGKHIGVSGTDMPPQALLGTSFVDSPEELEMGLDVFGRFAGLARGVRRLGSRALDLCCVATGRLDGCTNRTFGVRRGRRHVHRRGGGWEDYQLLGDRLVPEESKGLVASKGLVYEICYV